MTSYGRRPETLINFLRKEKTMKLTEIMILRNDVDGKTRLKKFLVGDNVLVRLTKIRGNCYKDDPRLRTVTDLPTMQQPQQPQIDPEMQARAEAAWAAHCMERKATPIQTVKPEPKPMSFEERLAHDWRHSPSLRREFASFGSYQAYMRAAESGRTKLYGCKS